jgi:hypothetical protein
MLPPSLPSYFGLALFGLLIPTTPLYADAIIAVAPVFSQIVASPQPEGFQTVFEDANATSYIREAVLEGQSVDKWTQMTTLTGAKGQATADAASDASKVAQSLAATYNSACPESFALAQLDAPQIKGTAATFAGYLSCGTVGGTDYSESMVFIVLVGKADVYTLQWAEHAAATATPIDYSAKLWSGRLVILAKETRLCDKVAGEPAPYPSCVE